MKNEKRFHFAVVSSSGSYGLGDTLPQAARNAYVRHDDSIIIAGDAKIKTIVGVDGFGGIRSSGALTRSPLFKPADLLETEDLAQALLDRTEGRGIHLPDPVFRWLEKAGLGEF